MDFTYTNYEFMLDLLKEKNYIICNYSNHSRFKKCVILRHDIDFTLQKALDFAKLENLKNISSTYFILLSTNFYNIFSKESFEILKEISNLGHHIGLHFDEKRYEINDIESLSFYVNKEKDILEDILGDKIQAVSMHRPSKWILENDINFDDIINTYSNHFLKDFKYLSDSRMSWRENALGIIEQESFERLHILIHPFWYSNAGETMKEKLINFIKSSKTERYNNIKGNFRDLEDVIPTNDIILK